MPSSMRTTPASASTWTLARRGTRRTAPMRHARRPAVAIAAGGAARSAGSASISSRPSPTGGPAAVDLPAIPEDLQSSGWAHRGGARSGTARRPQPALRRHLGGVLRGSARCSLRRIAGTRGEVFANFRGLVLATAGLPSGPPAHDPQPDEMASLGTVPFPQFQRERELHRGRSGGECGREGVLAVRAAHHAASRLSRVHRLRSAQLARHLHHGAGVEQPVCEGRGAGGER